MPDLDPNFLTMIAVLSGIFHLKKGQAQLDLESKQIVPVHTAHPVAC